MCNAAIPKLFHLYHLLKKVYRNIEMLFEKLTDLATSILGNSITFILAFALVIFWLTTPHFFNQDLHGKIENIILSTSFLSLFIIQKAFNRFSGSLHLKVNELVASHEPASNAVINIEGKTEFEIGELSKEYAEMAELALHAREEAEKKESSK